ncbi:MAG TPA: MFS transporter [Pilimelia sp.]|nr:MFS transporter [Pilimelia sp.]
MVIPRSRDWRLVFSAYVVSQIGSALTTIALLARAYDIDGSLASVALVGLAKVIPPLFIAPLAGAAADRFSKRRLLAAANLCCMPLVLSMAFVESSLVLFLLTAAVSAAATVGGPAELAFEAELVAEDQLLAAAGLRTVAGDLIAVVGPVTAGFLVVLTGSTTAFVVDAGTYATAAILVLCVRASGRPAGGAGPAAGGGPLHARPIRLVWQSPQLRPIFIAFAATVLVAAVQGPVFYTYIRQELHATSAVFGLLLAALGAGSVVGTLLLTRRPGLVVRAGVLLVVVVLPVDGLAVALLGSVHSPVVICLCAFVMGSLTAVFGTLVRYTVQVATDEHSRGRVFGLLFAIEGPLGAASLLVLPLMPAGTAPGTILVGSGLMELVAAAVAFLAYRQGRRMRPVPEQISAPVNA